MTRSEPLTCTWSRSGDHSGTVEVVGLLQFPTADTLLALVVTVLAAEPDLKDLRLHCAAVTHCDPYGLSVLLGVRRRTDTAGVDLHLDELSPSLDKILRTTNTLAHFTERVDELTWRDS